MFMPQIKPKYFADVPFVEAAKWILTGFFFKLYVANNLNEMTSYMSVPALRDAADAGSLAAGFPLQLSDLCGLLRLFRRSRSGLRLLFGYRLPINFNLPYISASFSEFWTRWHISLSTWLRTYLYIPLGGNRHGVLADLSEPDDRDGARRPLARRRHRAI